MKKKLALLMAAIMTVAMVPMTAFAATKKVVVDEVSTAAGEKHKFTTRVELVKEETTPNVEGETFDITLKLTNGKFDKDAMNALKSGETDELSKESKYIAGVRCLNDTTALVTLKTSGFNGNKCVLPIRAYAIDEGDVTVTMTSEISQFSTVKDLTIATAYENEIVVESDGVVTFVEDSRDNMKELKMISVKGLVNDAFSSTNEITLKLKGNFKFVTAETDKGNLWFSKDGKTPYAKGSEDEKGIVTFPNNSQVELVRGKGLISDDEITLRFSEDLTEEQLATLYISNIYITPTKGCDPGDTAKLSISSKDIESTKFEVAKMVEEAVTYTVEDDDLPVIWAGKDYDKSDDDYNTLEVSVEENTGDILNTSRKATFTFPEGIEVASIMFDKDDFQPEFRYEIDENVVTIWDYSTADDEKSESLKETDFGMKFLLNAAPTFTGDVNVTLGGEFDDVELKVATVKAPYTVEAKTSEVLIDYRYVPVNEIVITEAEDGILDDDDVIMLQVEKMDFEDAGKYEVTSGDIEVEVNIDELDKANLLTITVDDASTEASTITISGLELYLDRTLPVGGYALQNVMPVDKDGDKAAISNILWENSTSDDKLYDPDSLTSDISGDKYNAFFKYKAVTVNDSYVEVVTAGRDQDDSTTTKKIVITIGATTMAVGTETVTLDTPAYINAENYTELPLRAVSEAFGATVGWDDASRTVTIMMGQRIVSMTIGSKTMYINGTPVAMNTAPEIVSERTFLPVRDLCNALGITKIDWNEASATVTLN